VSARSSETSVNFYQTTQRLISQDGNLDVVPLVLNSEEVTVITVELGEKVSILLPAENKKRDNQLKLIRRRTYRNLPELSSGGFSSYFVSGKSHFRISATIPTIMTEVLWGFCSDNRNKTSDSSFIRNLHTNGTQTEMVG
jgi:hypothetical protein